MLGDTIVAVASPPGSASRAVVRLSGPAALRAANAVFAPALAGRRSQVEGAVRVLGFAVPALALVMPAPRSYTGEDTVELHVPGSPLLCAELQRAMADAVGGALRPARPGEFTARAWQHGRMDAAQVEGVLQLIHGEDAAAVAAGALWLGGGLSAAVARVQSLLQDALAMVELGLDFDAGETGAVADALWQAPLRAAWRGVGELRALVPAARPGGEVLLVGCSNAGKSSLCNALAGADAVLVDAAPGTTRDLVRVPIGGGAAVFDAPGDLARPGGADAAALQLRDRLAAQAGAVLLVVDPAGPAAAPLPSLPLAGVVFTKCDCWSEAPAFAAACAQAIAPLSLPADVPAFATSARRGDGIEALRRFLQQHARAGALDVGADLRTAIDQAAAAIERGREQPAAELVSADLQQALAALAGIAAGHSPEHLLDRIYARFCLGK